MLQPFSIFHQGCKAQYLSWEHPDRPNVCSALYSKERLQLCTPDYNIAPGLTPSTAHEGSWPDLVSNTQTLCYHTYVLNTAWIISILKFIFSSYLRLRNALCLLCEFSREHPGVFLLPVSPSQSSRFQGAALRCCSLRRTR
jgi:hypothetical protein